MNQELKIDDMNEEAYRQAYIQGFEAGMKHACELKQENARLRALIESKSQDENVDGWYE